MENPKVLEVLFWPENIFYLFIYLVFGFQGKENITKTQMDEIKSCRLNTIHQQKRLILILIDFI